ncbi:unnamed protein product [Orchesella dallaii]|uniref:C2H2-type domain-containing protein n=1 Tax=Orchesella dallaii TaxID=48710 RepID=A0ABP1QYB1_9HEXA
MFKETQSKSTENTEAPCTSHQPEDNLALPSTSKSSDPCQTDARLTTSIQTKRPRRERLQRVASASVEILASSQAQYELLPVTSKRNKYKCNSCGFEVTGKRRIEDHIKLHQETYQHASRKCEICGWLILKEGWSLHHVRHHPNNDHNLYRKFQPVGEIGTRYECKHCKYKTTENTKIQCHKTLHTNRIKESTKCKECKIRYHMSSFYLHDCYTKGLVGESLIHIKCNECGALCPNSAELRKHKCLHEKKEGTLCSKPGCGWLIENIMKHNRKWHSKDRVRKWQAEKLKSTLRETCPEDLISH